MPGPLPNPQRRRRNAPTVPSTSLPASGRKGRPPSCPYGLGDAGVAWWRWAWGLPQACAWGHGDLYAVARRALLEDEHARLEFVDGLDFADLLAGADDEAIRNVEFALSTLKGCATGTLAIKKEMDALDDRLGLNPKALAALRWSIVEDEPKAKAPTRDVGLVARGHLRAVDPALVG